MTDQERIAKLRYGTWDHTIMRGPNPTDFCIDETPFVQETADRIEELVKEKDRVAAINVKHCESVNTLLVDGARLDRRVQALEAKLARAVEALETIVDNGGAGSYHLARTTLAELDGK